MARCVTSGIAVISSETKMGGLRESPGLPAISPRSGAFRRSYKKLKNGGRNAIDIDANSI
jgi:hypothetical protein